MQADPGSGMGDDRSYFGGDRLAIVLTLVGAGLALLTGLLLWQSQGAAIFLSAAVSAVMTCF